MSLKTKIIKWNLLAIVFSLLATVLVTIIASRLLYLKYFGYFIPIGDIFKHFMFGKFLIELLVYILIAFVFILIVANSIVYTKISKSIIKPIEELKAGVKEMSFGNFLYKFNYTQMDEIGDIACYLQEVQNKLRTYIEQIDEHEQGNLELITSISHDLRTPITTILGYTEGILDNVANSEEKRKSYLLKIKKKAQDMDGLIDQLVFSAKLDLNKISYDLISTELVSFTNEILDEIKIDLETNNMIVSLINEAKSTAVNIDKLRFKRVILNIISNSIKYKKDNGGMIEVLFQNATDSLVISIKDCGIGMNKEKLPLIFDRFYRCDDSRLETSKSSGLGLSIAKMIIEAHNGKIWARSTLGQGTTIHISLKLY